MTGSSSSIHNRNARRRQATPPQLYPALGGFACHPVSLRLTSIAKIPQDLSTFAGVAGRDDWQERGGYSRLHRSHRSFDSTEGEIGHWVRTAALLAPVVVSEFVKDPERKLRFIRIASVAAAVLSEGMHAHKTFCDRERDRQALEACEAACAAL